MNTRVKTRIRKDPPLIEIQLSAKGPPRLFTRTWMAAMPPLLDEPGYACVVGEMYDGDVRQKSRTKMILDEAQALSPEDLEKAGLNPQDYFPLLYATLESGDIIPKNMNPVMEDLRGAAVALKDLYRPRQCLVPGGKENEPFYNWMRQTHGLMTPIPEADDAQCKKIAPFYVRKELLCPVVNEVPFWNDNEGYASSLINALISRGELVWWHDVPLWLSSTLKNPRIAVGMICAAMSLTEWQFHLEVIKPKDGYEDLEDQDEIERRGKRLRRQQAEKFWMVF